MEIKVLKHQSMGLTGRHVLKSIANEELTKLGLLVRECVQNSLDAAENKGAGNKVVVDAIIGKADAKDVNKIFTGLTSVLDKRYNGSIEYIAIRDSKTVGLTGPLRESELPSQGGYGNLRKLVYEFGQPQETFGGGGSWGIGKTVCFRMGCGLVIYYSRIKHGDKYQSRLAATLIENETNIEESLLANAKLVEGRTSTGIAWWGEIDPEDGSSYPVTNEKQIDNILSCFNVKPYLDKETGTCVIIPYINSEELIGNANPANIMHGDLAYFIRLIVQRWYFPRLINKEYKYGPWLDFRINGVSIKPAERYEYFSIMTKLYNLANDYLKGNTGVPTGYFVKKIELRGEFIGSGVAGVVAFTKVTDRDLKMLPPSNEFIPYTLLNRDDEDDETGNMPIIAYARQAGMVINYEILSAWTRSLPKMPEGEFVLAFFQPKGDQSLKDGYSTLDEYLRTGENADHKRWNDHEVNDRVRHIVDKIIKQVPKKMSEEIVVAQGDVKVQSEKALQKSLGKFFLPDTGFGKRAGKTGGKKPGSSGNKNPISKNLVVTLKESTYKNSNVGIPFNASLKKDCAGVRLFFKAHTSDKEIAADTWEKDLDKAFPVIINEDNTKATVGYNHTLKLKYIPTKKYASVYGVEILRDSTMVGDVKISGEIHFSCSEKTVSVRLLAEDMEISK